LKQARQPIVGLLGRRGGRETGDEQRCYDTAKAKLWNEHEGASLVFCLVFWLWVPPPAGICRITNSRLSRRLERRGGRLVHVHKTISFFRFVRYFGIKPHLGVILDDNLGNKAQPFLLLFRTPLGIP
jgi:hypothetical protein